MRCEVLGTLKTSGIRLQRPQIGVRQSVCWGRATKIPSFSTKPRRNFYYLWAWSRLHRISATSQLWNMMESIPKPFSCPHKTLCGHRRTITPFQLAHSQIRVQCLWRYPWLYHRPRHSRPRWNLQPWLPLLQSKKPFSCPIFPSRSWLKLISTMIQMALN